MTESAGAPLAPFTGAAGAGAIGDAADGNVTRLVHDEREIFVVGTAHVSQHSVHEVRRVITELRPDTVCVELDLARYETLTDETRWRRLELKEIVSASRAGLFLSSLLFSAFQKRLGDQVGVRPGAEMLAAIAAARDVGAAVVYADRDIQSTLTRCYAALGPVDRLKVIAALASLPFAAAEIDEAQIEQLKQRQAIGDAMDAFARQMPSLKVPLIDERDQYLMASTRSAPGKRVVSVVGAAHVAGMTTQLDTPVDLEALTALPVTTSRARFAAFVIPIAAWTVVTVALARAAPPPLGGLFTAFLAPAAIASAILVLASGGAIATVLVAAALSPLAVFAPSQWFGRLVGLVQSMVRPPSPEEAARIREEVLLPSAFRKNPFLAGLLVGPAARFGRTIGAVIGLVCAAIRLF
jgi:pheromone shutdown-related protein TraB